MSANVETLTPGHALGPASPLPSKKPEFEAPITDIRTPGTLIDLASALRSGLASPKSEHGQRSIPSLLLWDEAGLKHFEEITYTEDYYLTNTEITLLEAHALQIGRRLAQGTMLLELGSGNLRKTNILLEALEQLAIRVDYYALDLDRRELVRTLKQLRPSRFKYIRVHGLLGTYDDGQQWIARSDNHAKPKCILSLGSTLGCMNREEASDFCRGWATTIKRTTPDATASRNHILLGLDNNQEAQKVKRAYADAAGANKRFILNALNNANSCLGYQAFDPADWTVHGIWNTQCHRHEQHLVPLKDIDFEGNTLLKGEHILVANSHKYSQADLRELATGAGLKRADAFLTDDETYGLYLFHMS